MSIKKWPGAVVSDTPVEPAGNYQDSAASGVWTLEQQAYWEAQGLWPVPGNTNPDLFIENLFSTYLYTGNGSTQTITNGIDLAGEGGLVWVKGRSSATYHILTDSARGAPSSLYTNVTNSADNTTPYISALNSNGFNVEFTGGSPTNTNAATYTSWTFRKQPKFFDIVTYTGNGLAGRQIPHNLGSVPGMFIIKSISNITGWVTWHRGLADGGGYGGKLNLETTSAASTGGQMFGTAAQQTDSVITFGSTANITQTNGDGFTYVAYLFAHDAGGFGADGTENVISCGSVTDNSGVEINLGWEPQWILAKRTDASQNWFMFDNMRGWGLDGWTSLNPNLTAVESAYTGAPYWVPTATGIRIDNAFFGAGASVIYVAIRRGPMATPTSGTEVFAPVAYTGDGTTRLYPVGFPTDLSINMARSLSLRSPWWTDRLRGDTVALFSDGAGAEGGGNDFALDYQTSIYVSATRIASGETYINWNFKRAPGFMDVVGYTGNGTAGNTVAHNLGVAPELMIVKCRSTAKNWIVYHKGLNNGTTPENYDIQLNGINSEGVSLSSWNNTAPTATEFTVGNSSTVNGSGSTYVAYLFATLAGVSKVGSYTGTGADINVDCGFTTGARFVLIKRTDSTGDWYVWDSARGIVAGNDPYLLLNNTAAEVTSTDYVDADPAGFTVTSTAPAALNASGGAYIFLAIA